MKYQARAINAEHTVVQWEFDALDRADAQRQVRERGLHLVHLRGADVQGTGLMGRLQDAMGRRSSPLPLVMFSQELLALLQAGLGLVEGLEALLEKEAQPALRLILSGLLQALRDGRRFSSALAEQSRHFPPLYVGLVRASEGTSSLPYALERFIAYQQRIDAVRSKVVSAAIYPAILISVGTLVSLFLMVYVVPRFAEVYQGAGRQMPWLSQQMLGLSSLLTDHLEVLLALALAALLMAGASAQKFRAAGGWMGLLSRLPGVGERVRVYELSRLYMTLGLLLEGGISLVAAMETVDSVVSPAVAQRLRLASAQVQTGAPVSLAFSAQNLTTPISLRMLAVGERSGDLGGMLRQSAAFYDGEITRWIDRFMRSFELLLMTAIGLVVGVIVVLLYMPIFDLAGSF